MVPAEFMAAAVSMHTDALPQLLHLGNKLFTSHLVKVGVHSVFRPSNAASKEKPRLGPGQCICPTDTGGPRVVSLGSHISS